MYPAYKLKHGSRRWLLGLFGFLLLGCQAGDVTLDAYLERLRSTHPLFTGEKLTADIASAEREALRGREDWQLSGRPFASFDQPTTTSSFSADQAAALGFDLGLERQYWNNGSRVGLRYNYQHSRQDAATFPVFGPNGETMDVETGLPRFFQHSVLLNYTLPLLRNKGGSLDRLEYDVRALAVESARLQASENEEDFLLQAARRYIDWAEADKLLKISMARALLAKTQFDSVTERRLDNLSSEADVARAEADWRTARQAIALSQARRNGVQAELAALAQWEDLMRARPALDIESRATLPAAFAHSRLVELFNVEAARIRLQQGGVREEEKPTLDLDLRGGLAGGDRDFIDGLVLDRPTAQAAVVYRVPLGNRSVKARIKANDLRLEKVAADQQNIIRRIESTLRGLHQQIRDYDEVMKRNDEQIAAAGRRTEAELDEYDRGKNLLSFVIQSQDAEANARSVKVNNAAVRHKLVLEYRALMDDLYPTTDMSDTPKK